MVFYLYSLSKVDNILELNDISLYHLFIGWSNSIDGDSLNNLNDSIEYDSDNSDYLNNSYSDNDDCKSLEPTWLKDSTARLKEIIKDINNDTKTIELENTNKVIYKDGNENR